MDQITYDIVWLNLRQERETCVNFIILSLPSIFEIFMYLYHILKIDQIIVKVNYWLKRYVILIYLKILKQSFEIDFL